MKKTPTPLIQYVLIVSRYFPKNEYFNGKQTDFVTKIKMGTKEHTLRDNYKLWAKRFEKIDKGLAYLSLRFWENEPYRSKQIEFRKLFKTDGISIEKITFNKDWLVDDKDILLDEKKLARNDGLSLSDFNEWFKKDIGTGNEKAIIRFTPNRYELPF